MLRGHLDFATLAQNHRALMAFRDAHYLPAVLIFLAAYTGLVAFSLPGASLATLTGGFLFGTFPGLAFNVMAATAGGLDLFLAAGSGRYRDGPGPCPAG